eukprot:g1725.t1
MTKLDRILPCAISILKERNLLSAMTNENLANILNTLATSYRNSNLKKMAPPSVYVGFDPTASSLHVGNLVSVRALEIFQASGFRPIALIGGATGLIGDPSGKSTDRKLLNVKQVQENQRGIEKSLKRVLNIKPDEGHEIKLVNNIEWYDKMSAFEFVRDIGQHFRLSQMLSKDSVKNRLESDVGISFTEFSYQMFQANDFYHLHQKENCVLQIGGSDQWGNIVAGCDLIRKRVGRDISITDKGNKYNFSSISSSAFGITVPLMTTSSGEKLGKSAGNAVWIDPDKTSPYDFYQYFMQIKDEDVIRLIPQMGVHVKLNDKGEYMDNDVSNYFSINRANDVIKMHLQDPGKRYAQTFLADSMTTWVHGEEECRNVSKISKRLFQTKSDDADSNDNVNDILNMALQSGKVTIVDQAEVMHEMKIIELGLKCNAIKSKGEGKRLVKNGGLYINNMRVEDINEVFDVEKHLIQDEFVMLRIGKKSQYILKIS